jgi:hypothetical protein
MIPLLQVLVGGGFIVAVVNGLFMLFQQRMASKEKNTEKQLEAAREQLEAAKVREVKDGAEKALIRSAVLAALHYQIECVAKAHLRAGFISFDDRQVLLKIYEIYHDMGGNGNVKAMMDSVMDMPLACMVTAEGEDSE